MTRDNRLRLVVYLVSAALLVWAIAEQRQQPPYTPFGIPAHR